MNNTGFTNGMGQPLQPPSNFPQQQVPYSQYGVYPSQPAQGMMNGSPRGVPYGNAATAKKPSAKAMALIILGTGIVFLLVGLLMERGSDSVPARQTETSAVAKAMLSESLFSGKFVVEGHEYQMLKTTPSDLLSNGWTWADSDYLIKQDEIVPPGESELVALVKPEYEADLQIWITNTSNQDMPGESCPLTGIYAEASKITGSGSLARGTLKTEVIDASFPPFTLAGGAELGMDYANLKELYGEPVTYDEQADEEDPTYTDIDAEYEENGSEWHKYAKFSAYRNTAVPQLDFVYYRFELPDGK